MVGAHVPRLAPRRGRARERRRPVTQKSPTDVASDSLQEWIGIGVLVSASVGATLAAIAASGLRFANAGPFFEIFGLLFLVAAALNAYQYVRMPENKRMIFFMNMFLVYLVVAISGAVLQNCMALFKAVEISAILENADHAIGFHWRAFSMGVHSVPYLSEGIGFCYRNWIRETFVVLLALTATRKFDDLFTFTASYIIAGVITLGVSGVFDAKSREAVAAYANPAGMHLPSGVSPLYIEKLEHMRHGLDNVMHFDQMIGLVAFPSLHAGMAILLAVAMRNVRWLWLPFLAFNVVVVVGTITEGGHNLMDVLAGLAFAVLAVALAQAFRNSSVAARIAAMIARPTARPIGSAQA
jgi:membrane-associated phospholipid phosphatase